jgi:hypothetical protein
MKIRKGISLIVLIITIIVIIILAGSILLSLSSNNPIEQSNKAKFKKNLDEYNSELSLVLSKKYLENYSFDFSKFNAKLWNGSEDPSKTIKEYITCITEEDALKFEIQNSKLVYVGDNTTEKVYGTEMGLIDKVVAQIDIIAVQNATFNGKVAAYNNPIIPKGFKAVNTADANWTNLSVDFNKGLVIEDTIGNQFVWVPVDENNVKYKKWCTAGIAWDNASISDDILPLGVTNEANQINDYGGFYIGRYEAGNAAGILVTKKNASIWRSINYANSKTKAESMYTTPVVKSGLVTGKQWDTTMEWIKDSGKNVSTDSSTWGNYSLALFPANVPGFGSPQLAGFSEFWKANNIYDIAGSVYEWTNEIYIAGRISRGGAEWTTGTFGPAGSRYDGYPSNATSTCLGFRVVLYIL